MNDRKDIDDNDKQVFHDAMHGITPLKRSNKISRPRPSGKLPKPIQVNDEEAELTRLDVATPEIVNAEDSLSFARIGIQHKVLKRLKQGKVSIQAELDLHGMTSLEAESALQQFLQYCLEHNYRIVRIIHGKGYGAKSATPKLKNKVNLWLQELACVLAFCSAPRHDGGTGSVYVILKKESSEACP